MLGLDEFADHRGRLEALGYVVQVDATLHRRGDDTLAGLPEFCFVLAGGQNNFFHELVDAIRHELEAVNVPSSVCEGAFPRATEDRVFVLVPPHEYYRLDGSKTEPTWD